MILRICDMHDLCPKFKPILGLWNWSSLLCSFQVMSCGRIDPCGVVQSLIDPFIFIDLCNDAEDTSLPALAEGFFDFISSTSRLLGFQLPSSTVRAWSLVYELTILSYKPASVARRVGRCWMCDWLSRSNTVLDSCRLIYVWSMVWLTFKFSYTRPLPLSPELRLLLIIEQKESPQQWVFATPEACFLLHCYMISVQRAEHGSEAQKPWKFSFLSWQSPSLCSVYFSATGSW